MLRNHLQKGTDYHAVDATSSLLSCSVPPLMVDSVALGGTGDVGLNDLVGDVGTTIFAADRRTSWTSLLALYRLPGLLLMN